MNRKRLNKIKREIAQARRAPQKARQLEELAQRLGRKMVTRGKEPVWESQAFNDLFPLAIPRHGGRDLAPGTQRSILDQLEDDVAAWDQVLEDEIDDEAEWGNEGSENGEAC
jgi:hypothetical protein